MGNQIITQQMRYRKSLISYAKKHGVTKTAITYKTNRQYVYRWLQRYNGDIRSLANASTKPKSHPNAHTSQEIKLIRDMYMHNKNTGLVRFWIKLKLRGYDRSITGLYRIMIKLKLIQKSTKKKVKVKTKPYIQMTFPGERIQVDIKTVPLKSISGNFRLYQYTAIDEFSRVRFLQMYSEKSTYTSYKFIKQMIKYYPFQIYTVRTDNGAEFTKRLLSKDPNDKTMMEYYLKKMGIAHDLIKPYTPKHNGKVERSHRKDSEQFYSHRRFYSLEDARKQLRIYNNEYNKFPMKPLNWKSPNEVLRDYLSKLK
jgi:transposase InsO family protein